MNPPVIDCHTHIDQRWLTHDAALLRGMLRRCDATGVEAMVVSIYTTPQGPGTDLDMLGRIFRDFDVRLAVTVGYPSPASADELQALPEHLDGSLRAAREAAKRPEVVGIGEVGLDYYWPQKEWMPGGEVHALESAEDRGAAELDKYPLLENCLRAQAEIFTRWIDLAQEFELPLVVHERDSRADTARLLRDSGIDPRRVAYHCFAGTAEQAVEAAGEGYWISVPSSAVWREPFRSIATTTPLQQMLTETDAPYHSPMAQLWKKLFHEARQWAEAEGLQGRRRDNATLSRRRDLFRAALERDYTGLEFDVWSPEVGLETVSALDHLGQSRRRNENESSFVRAVPRTVAQMRELDYDDVCAALAANARRFYRL